MHYVIDIYRVESSSYLHQLGKMYLHDRWVWLVMPLLVCLVLAAGLSDVRWIVAGAMIMFMVIPMILALSYINYALSMEARWSVLEKEMTLDDDGMTLRFSDVRMGNRLVRWTEVNNVRVAGESFLLMLNVRRYTFVMIPFAAIEQAGIPLKEFARDLTRAINSVR